MACRMLVSNTLAYVATLTSDLRPSEGFFQPDINMDLKRLVQQLQLLVIQFQSKQHRQRDRKSYLASICPHMINTNSYVEKLVPCSRYKKFGSITLGILSWGNLIDPNSYTAPKKSKIQQMSLATTRCLPATFGGRGVSWKSVICSIFEISSSY